MLTVIRIRLARRKAFKQLKSGDYDQAIESLKELLELDPQEQYERYLGMAYMGAGRYKESERRLKNIIKQYGEYYPRVRALADLYFVWRKREKAHRYYQQALEMSEGTAEKLITERIRHTESEEAFEAVPKAEQAYRDGTVAFGESDFDTALARFREATQLDPTHVLAWNNLGAVLMNGFKDYDGAEQAFKTAMDYEPLQMLRDNLQRLELSRNRERKGSKKESEKQK